MKRLLYTPFIVFFHFCIYANTPKDTILLRNYRQFHFNYANDVYDHTDRYLTQIASFELYTSYKIEKTNRLCRNHFTLQQNVYTPSDIFGDTIQRNDRPYCSTLTLNRTRQLFYIKEKIQLNTGLTLGTLGKFAFGEQMQREVHYAVNSRQALGWRYQLASAPFVNFHTGLEKGLIVRKNIDYIVSGTINAGNVFNDLTIGQVIHLHRHDNYFRYLNLSKTDIWRLSFSLKNELKIAGYNGTLQGAIGSRNNPYLLTHKEISPVVFYNQGSIHFGYGRMEITLSKSLLSKEFKAGMNHKWSAVRFCRIF